MPFTNTCISHLRCIYTHIYIYNKTKCKKIPKLHNRYTHIWVEAFRFRHTGTSLSLSLSHNYSLSTSSHSFQSPKLKLAGVFLLKPFKRDPRALSSERQMTLQVGCNRLYTYECKVQLHIKTNLMVCLRYVCAYNVYLHIKKCAYIQIHK